MVDRKIPLRREQSWYFKDKRPRAAVRWSEDIAAPSFLPSRPMRPRRLPLAVVQELRPEDRERVAREMGL